MKRVVILSPDFTPSSYPPALRTRFFASYLREFGWEPVIITLDPNYYEWAVDPENLQLLPESLQVIRTPAVPASLTRKIGVGDIGLRSLWHHWQVLKTLCQRKLIDLIFISAPPFFPFLLGRWAYESFGVPYVLDYIDPWFLSRNGRSCLGKQDFKRKSSRRLSVILEPFVLRRASYVTAVSWGTLKILLDRYAWLSRDTMAEIPYGGEPGDFEYLACHPRQNSVFDPKDKLFHMSYAGTCPETMSFALEIFFKAVRLGLERDPVRFGILRLHFIGTVYQGNGLDFILPLARKFNLEDIVDENTQRTSYLDALQLLLDSQALLILGSTAPHYVPSKIPTYLLAKKPVLSILHEESLGVSILKDVGAGELVTFNVKNTPLDGVNETAASLKRILLSPGNYEHRLDSRRFEPFTVRATASRLAQVFDRVVSSSQT